MFIRFEGTGVQKTIHCRSYEVMLSRSCREKLIRIDDELSQWHLSEGVGCWNRAYIMNDDGHTIETIIAPSLKAFKDQDREVEHAQG